MGHIITVGIECGIGFFFAFSMFGALECAGKRANILADEVHRLRLKMDADNERMNEVLETLQQIRDQTRETNQFAWETNELVGNAYDENLRQRIGLK